MTSILLFLIRLVAAVIVLALIVVATQTFQIFPGVVAGLFLPPKRDVADLPPGVEGKFITTSDGKKLEVWYLKANSSAAEAVQTPVAVFFHGNAEDVDKTFDLQQWFQSIGISSYSFDYRGYGRSSGWPTDEGLRLDTKAALDLVASENDLSKQKLILVGNSIGSGLAAYGATLIKPHTILFLSPYTSLRALVESYPILGYLAPFLWFDLNTVSHLKNLSDIHIISVHGSSDTTIPVQHSRELIGILTNLPDRKLIEIEGAGHNDLIARGQAEISKELLAALKR